MAVAAPGGSSDGVSDAVVVFEVEHRTAQMTVSCNDEGMPSFVRVVLGGLPPRDEQGRLEAQLELLNRGLRQSIPLEILFALLYDEDIHPLGRTGDQDIPLVPSMIAFVIRWLALHYLPFEVRNELGVLLRDEVPVCLADGSRMSRAGSCFVCPQCGTTSGCS